MSVDGIRLDLQTDHFDVCVAESVNRIYRMIRFGDLHQKGIPQFDRQSVCIGEPD